MGDEMKLKQAMATAAEIEKILAERGVWYTMSKVNQGGLRFIKFEASIKVKAQ